MSFKYTDFCDERGSLIPVEFKWLPFVPQRLFVVRDVPEGVIRGEHAHYVNKQYLICLQGKIEVVLNDGEREVPEIILKDQAVYVDRLIWDYQRFLEKGSVLLVLCSTPYDLSDYIFDFEEYKRIRKSRS